jgi:hypothetical protein
VNTPPPLPSPTQKPAAARRSWVKIFGWYLMTLLLTGTLSSLLRERGMSSLPSNIIGMTLFIWGLAAPHRQSTFLNLPQRIWLQSTNTFARKLWWLSITILAALPLLRLYQFANPPSDTAFNHGLGFVAQLSSLSLGLLIAGIQLLADPVVLLITAVSITLLLLLIRRQNQRNGQLPAWSYGILILGLLAANATLDMNPDLFLTQCVITFCFLGNARGTKHGPALALRGIYLIGGICSIVYLEHQNTGHAASAAGVCFLVFASFIASGIRTQVLERKVTWIFLSAAITQVFASMQPLLFTPAGSPYLLSSSAAYGYCEDPASNHVWMTFPRCSAFPRHRNEALAHEQCRGGTLEAFDFNDSPPTLYAKHAPFSPNFFGRLEQPICLEESIIVGMTDVMLDAKKHGGSTMVVKKLSGEVSNKHVFSSNVGHTVAWDNWSRRLFAVDEFSSLAQFYSPATHQVERFGQSLDNESLTLDGRPLSQNRQSIFISEHYFGDEVIEFNLEDGDERSRYLHNNGGGWAATVDDNAALLFISGMWSLDVFDLRSGAHLKRHRTGFGARAAMVSATQERVYLPCTLSGTIRVFDRQTLKLVKAVPVGLGIRNLHLTQNETELLGSNSGGTLLWDLNQLP